MNKKLVTFIGLCFLLSAANAQMELLKTNQFFPQINSAQTLQSGDINGDGLLDVLVVTGHNEGVIIYLNAGSNQLILADKQLQSGGASDVAVDDFDGDGDLDIWVIGLIDEYYHSEKLYINDGSGNFDLKTGAGIDDTVLYGVGELLTGDMDHNGDVDTISIIREESNFLQAFMYSNNGQGIFSREEIAVSHLGHVEMADFNDDGLTDLWSMGAGLRIYLNDGSGQFNDSNAVDVDVNLGDGEFGKPILADIDQDGDLDIQTFSDRYYLPRIRNNGDGTFTELPVLVSLSFLGNQLGLFVDADDDQDLDFWLAFNGSNSSSIIKTTDDAQIDINSASINLDEKQVYALHAADLDNDGDTDVVSVGVNGISVWEKESSDVYSQQAQEGLNIQWGDNHTPTTIDLNADGHLDVVIAGESGVKQALGNGRGGLSDLTKVNDESVFRFHTADVNGDGFGDVITINNNLAVKLLRNNQNGSYSISELPTSPQLLAYGISTSDIDLDGDLDVMLQGYLGSINILMNQGGGQFELSQTIEGGFRTAALVDLDQSGETVLVAQNLYGFFGETTLGVIEYRFENGRFSKSRVAEIENMFQKNLVFFDHDSDGDLDILTNHAVNDGFTLLLNQGAEFVFSEFHFPYGPPFKAADMNQDGAMDILTEDGQVYLSTSDGFEQASNQMETTGFSSLSLADLDHDTDLDLVLNLENTGLSVSLNTTIDSDFNGLWFNPAENGHGIQVEEINLNGTVQVHVSWYVYHQGEQLWLTGVGPVDGSVAHVEHYITSGPDFGVDYDAQDLLSEPWGTATLTLQDNHTMTYAWDGMPYGFGTGSMALSRLAGIKATSQTAFGINSCHSGSWYSPSEDGHGYMVQVVDIGGQANMVLTWYTYLNGEQYWMTAVGALDGNEASLSAQVTTGGHFPPDFDTTEVDFIDWGGIHFKLLDNNRAIISWQSGLPEISAGQLSVQRLTLIDRYSCH